MWKKNVVTFCKINKNANWILNLFILFPVASIAQKLWTTLDVKRKNVAYGVSYLDTAWEMNGFKHSLDWAVC